MPPRGGQPNRGAGAHRSFIGNVNAARCLMQLRRTFDSAAERYDRARPGYPPQVFEDLATLAELESGSRILEIGCGTGQATVPLAERGYEVLAVELGAELAVIARRRLAAHSNAEVVVSAFEDWAIPDEPFDAVVSADAFHWLDPEIRITKAAQALRRGGSLAIIENRHRPVASDHLLAEFSRCHERWGSTSRLGTKPAADQPPENLAEVEQSGLFDRVASRRYEWDQEYATRQYLELLMTFSDVLALEPAQQQGLLGCIGELIDRELHGRVGEHNITQLLIARKGAGANLGA